MRVWIVCSNFKGNGWVIEDVFTNERLAYAYVDREKQTGYQFNVSDWAVKGGVQ